MDRLKTMWRERYRYDVVSGILCVALLLTWAFQNVRDVVVEPLWWQKAVGVLGALSCLALTVIVTLACRVRCYRCDKYIRAREAFVTVRPHRRLHVRCAPPIRRGDLVQ